MSPAAKPVYSARRAAEGSVWIVRDGLDVDRASAREALRFAGDLMAAAIDALREEGGAS